MLWSDESKCRVQGLAEQLHGTGLRARQAKPGSLVQKLSGQKTGCRVEGLDGVVKMLAEQNSDLK